MLTYQNAVNFALNILTAESKNKDIQGHLSLHIKYNCICFINLLFNDLECPVLRDVILEFLKEHAGLRVALSCVQPPSFGGLPTPHSLVRHGLRSLHWPPASRTLGRTRV